MRRSLVFLLSLLPLTPLYPATLPAGFSETRIPASGSMTSPTAMAFAPDGRIFVCEQGGQLRVIKNGALLATPFLSLTVDSSGERGLLGVAFDPQFATNNFVYVYYTTTTPATHNRISRFTANGDVAVAGSEVVILELNNLSSATNHNGGAIHFGPDGKLYVAVGDNANGTNSQTLGNLLGKILRLNADGSIPTDNPYYNTATGQNRVIWSMGLRNPFTFTFQQTTGRMFINDVGQSTWEEIDDGIAGSNYGWPNTEGPTSDPQYRSPLFWYGHGSTSTTGCAITGGTFYNPATPTFPSSYYGRYFFADYCTGWIRLFDPSTGNASDFASGINAPVDLSVQSDGTLYYLARGTGAVFAVQYTANQAPAIVVHPSNQSAPSGSSATFSVTATGTQPLGYQWQRNNGNITGANASTLMVSNVSGADSGAQFRCIVSNSFGTATSNSATLTVTANTAPAASIDSPAPNSTYAAGDVVAFSGSGTDAEDGVLPASAFTWRVDFHHDAHTHPFMASTSGIKNGSFTIPTSGETSTNVWYRIDLTVTDSNGASTTVTRDITPRVATLTLNATPSGAKLTVDGQPVVAPNSFGSVVNMTRSIGVVTPQIVGGRQYVFNSWSDGGASTHSISAPATNTTYSATVREGASPLADFDGNGSADLMWRNVATGANALWLMSGTNVVGVVDLPGIPNTDYRLSGASDFNGDGKPDLVWRNATTGLNALWLMNGTSYASTVDLPAIPNSAYRIAATGDFNGDGKADILWRNDTTGAIAVWLMNGTSYASTVDLTPLTARGWTVSGAGDFNGDGWRDLLLRNAGNSSNSVWLMNGTQVVGTVTLPGLAASFQPEAFVDLNADGTTDIVWRNYANTSLATLAAWLMQNDAVIATVDMQTIYSSNYQLGGPK